MNDDKLLAKILANPRVLWRILARKDIRILGPWREAKGRNWSIANGWRRFSPCGPNTLGAPSAPSVTVYKTREPEEPEDYQFYEWGGVDREALAEAIEEWEIERAKWKVWKYTFDNLEFDLPHGYANTKEAAQLAADSTLRSFGYMLYDGD